MNIGIDLIAIKKFQKLKAADYKIWAHVFTRDEWAYAFRAHHARAAEHLAGMFAAKEAAMKASRKTGITHFKTFEIEHTAQGAPRLNKRGYRVSISHDHAYAIAVVLVG